MVWSRKFEEPITLPDGRNLIRLRDAANYIIDLPPETFSMPNWQHAMAALSQVTERSPTTLARRAFLQALKSDVQNAEGR